MSDQRFILHHYDESPYAEKIRLMFGIGGGEWHSLLSPVQPPRPNIDPLAGGYRRIPVAQIGADIFCDTTLIAGETAVLLGMPTLAAPIADSSAESFARRAEEEVFFAAIGSVPPMRLLLTLLGNFGVGGSLRFIKDRSRMMDGATVRPLRGAAAVAVMDAFQQDLDELLQDRAFAAGETISYADLCLFHPLWLRLRVGKSDIPTRLSALRRWFSAIEAFGHGRRIEIDQDVAFTAARGSEPRALPEILDEDSRVGGPVVVAPVDYGKDPVQGQLVALSSDRIIIARQTTDFGVVHIHFPRTNYTLASI